MQRVWTSCNFTHVEKEPVLRLKLILLFGALALGLSSCQAPEPARGGGSTGSGGPGGPTPTPTPTPPIGEPCADVEARWCMPYDLDCPNFDASSVEHPQMLGFRIYYGFSPGVYTAFVDVPDPAARDGQVSNLEFGRDYYMAMTAYASPANAGEPVQESVFSNERLKPADECPTVLDFSRAPKSDRYYEVIESLRWQHVNGF